MSQGNRHFATIEGSGEEVIIIGYRAKTNDVLVAIPAALTQEESQNLRMVVQSAAAQGKDYLMDQVGGSVLGGAHHPSAGVDWQTFLLRAAASGRSSVARRMTIKELNFLDPSQKAFFGGYGPSIEPEVDARRKSRIQAQDAALNGQALPEPAQVAPAPVAAPVEPAAPAVDPVQAAMLEALSSIAAGQAALTEKLDSLGAAKKPASRRKPAAKKKAAPKKAAAPAPAPEPEVEVTPVVADTAGFATEDAIVE